MQRISWGIRGARLILVGGLPLLGGVAFAQTGAVLQAPSEQGAAQTADPATGGEQAAPVALTLRGAIEMALRNSKDIQVAKLQASIAEHASQVGKSEFMPNLYAGSGAGYTYGIPETPGGRAPSVFNVTYTEQVFNEPLKGQGKELEEQARSQKIVLEDVKNSVIERTAMAYLELAKVRHSLELLRAEQESADKILQVTQERQGEGYELPMEVTKDAVDESGSGAANFAAGGASRRAGSVFARATWVGRRTSHRSHTRKICQARRIRREQIWWPWRCRIT